MENETFPLLAKVCASCYILCDGQIILWLGWRLTVRLHGWEYQPMVGSWTHLVCL